MQNPVTKVAFIGLGVMGYPMARHLVKAGYDVTVYNRTTAKADAWLEQFETGRTPVSMRPETAPARSETVAGAACDADIVFACVGEDADVARVTWQEGGAFEAMKKGALFVDHTTASAECARICAQEARARGLDFIDAPVSGGQAGAENGQLTIMCGGSGEAFKRMEPVAKSYAKSLTLMGDVGAGQQAKMVNQLCIAGVLAGLSEGLALAEASGLDVPLLLEALKGGAAGSWQMENRLGTMAQRSFEFGFAVDWMRKDLKIALAEAKSKAISLPHAEKVDQAYARVQEQGGARYDTSSLMLGWFSPEA